MLDAQCFQVLGRISWSIIGKERNHLVLDGKLLLRNSKSNCSCRKAFTTGIKRVFQVRTIRIPPTFRNHFAIGTAILRLELYADSVKPDFRKSFAKYLDARIAYFDAGADIANIHLSLERSNTAADSLWNIAASHSRYPANLVASNQMVPALNQMFDIANSRFWSEYNRTPTSILTMLVVLCLSAAFAAGHTSVGEGKFDWFMAIGFCMLISIVVYCIIDLDRPRVGIITLEENARAISDLRKMFK